MLENRLGTLERDVMAIAWARREVSVREVCAQLDASVAYTTVMTTMDRLAVSERDRALLDELERLIREKRRAVDRGKPR